MNKSNNGKHATPEQEPLHSRLADLPESPDHSSRWFAYIAVGITLVAMAAGLAVMGRLAYLFFRR